jgi:hypothetical protein
MPTPKMRPDEIDIDRALVGQLIAKQFPQWADLLITKVHSAGTDNAIYRLGDDMAVRLPVFPAPPRTWTPNNGGYRSFPRCSWSTAASRTGLPPSSI